jgi:ATP-dependent RNA helicase RhlE
MSYSYRSTRSSSVASRYSRTRTGQRKNTRSKAAREYIDPSRFIKVATIAQAEVYEPRHTFADFALHDLLKTNLTTKGYVTPSPIQDQAIPVGLAGKDVIGIASTGTGKTAAFALPVLQQLISDRNSAALVIAPTRELAQQIEEECKLLARGSGLFGALIIGGTNMAKQLRDLKQKPRVVIGTPGRLKDHLQRGSLQLGRFNMVVLDEVDRMLDMGFVNDVTEILSQTSQTRQAFFFSATIDPKVRKLIDTFTHDPYTVSLKASSASENVHQNVVRFQGNMDKIDKLHNLLIHEEVKKVIVFDETQRSVERLNRELVARGFSADAIHGGKTQGQRQRALARLKKDEISILVATDVAARGIDVADITHVVNYSVPKAYDDYIHRIGRAGRAGKIGHALTFIAN